MKLPTPTADAQAIDRVDLSGCGVTDLTIPQLVAEVYGEAPLSERGQLIEQLLRPLGLLSLFGVAGGVFAKAKLRGGWRNLHIPLDDLRSVQTTDVVALVEHAQQISVDVLDSLAQLLKTTPVLAASAAAVLLLALLTQRAQSRSAGPSAHPPGRG